MKSEFYLRSRGAINKCPRWVFGLIIAVAAAITIYVGEWVAVFLLFFPCIGLIFLLWLSNETQKQDGIYIKGDRIYTKSFISEKDILPQQIAGIKIMHMFVRYSGAPDSYYPQYYENGEPIYTIFLLSEIVQNMYNYKRNEWQFGECFKEEIIAEAEYDPEAVKYLKTLNPDIKVFY